MKTERDEAYILHRRAFKESSVVMECFSRQGGWISLVGRGAKRARSRFDALLQPFILIEMEWGGRGDLKTLYKAESKMLLPILKQEKLIVGLYLNELLVRLLQRADPHPLLFDFYHTTLQKLTLLSEDFEIQKALRQFEVQLLSELGYGLGFESDTKGYPISLDLLYSYDPKIGIYEIAEGSIQEGCIVSGAALLALQQNDYPSEMVLREAKKLMRFILGCYLGNKPLETRKLYRT